MRLKNKVAIVTGGSSGIGRAICHAYAREGAVVIIVNKNKPKNGILVANEIKSSGGLAESIQCDISNPIEVDALVQKVIKNHGHIDILVNNAGALVFKNIEDSSLDEWDTVINVNLRSAFLLLHAIVPHMKKRRYGKIIFVSSLAAIRGLSGASAYAASKGGILALAKSMVAELAGSNINVNLITPGFTATGMNQELRSNPDFMEQIKPPPSGHRLMQPEELTGAAVYLASEDSRCVHGVDLIVDGGVAAVQ
jgi:3-oxoacyl-[acyl-carrier protein] reductase